MRVSCVKCPLTTSAGAHRVDDLEDAKDRAAELRGSVDSNEKQLDRLATDIEQARAAYAAVEEEVDAAAAEQQKLEDRVDILNKELDQMQAELDPLRVRRTGLRASDCVVHPWCYCIHS